jgi:hypothetical protein
MCTRAIKAETIAIQHKVIASSMLEGAAGTQNKEDAFESSFRDMCYLLQLFLKGIHTIKGRVHVDVTFDSDIIETMKSELLRNCGSCLAKRITEYCMFKNAVQEKQKTALLFESELRKS